MLHGISRYLVLFTHLLIKITDIARVNKKLVSNMVKCFGGRVYLSGIIKKGATLGSLIGIVHLVRTQNFPKNQHFLSPDKRTYVCVSGGKKCWFFGKFCMRTKWMITQWFCIRLLCHYVYSSNLILFLSL